MSAGRRELQVPRIYEENGGSGETLDLSTCLSNFFAFLAAFFATFAVFLSCLVFLDILMCPPNCGSGTVDRVAHESSKTGPQRHEATKCGLSLFSVLVRSPASTA
jgi:hypothetical protein